MDADIVTDPSYAQLKLNVVAKTAYLMLVAESFYILTVLAFKISLGLFFLRITKEPQLRMVVYITIGISTAFSIAYFFFVVFQCGVPKNAMTFILSKLRGRCRAKATALGMAYTHALVVSLTDFVFAILPLALLKNSLLDRREKWIVGLILVMGTV